MTINVGITGLTSHQVFAIEWLLRPYKIETSRTLDDSDIIISGVELDCAKPIIRLTRTNHTHGTSCGNGIVEIPIDLISACYDMLRTVMNPRIGLSYKLATSLPFQYNAVPPWIRNWFLRRQVTDCNLINHLDNEHARRTLNQAFDSLGFSLEPKNPPVLLITHDIETARGLENALLLKAVEDKLEIQSTWFVPSNEYPIPKQIAKELAEGSTIGSHDIRHDGRLIHIKRHEQLVERLSKSKTELEAVFETQIDSFRSPLMQFSRRIAVALSEAGYTFDSSLPCWDPAHPPSGTGFGIQFLHRFELNDLLEIPLTLIQDHQALSLLGLTTAEAADFLIDQATLVHKLEGDIVVLVHPDYAFSRDLRTYGRLLMSLMKIHNS